MTEIPQEDGAAGAMGAMASRPAGWQPIPDLDPGAFPAQLRELAAKVRDGVRLDEADALTCLTTPHLLHLGRLAGAGRRQRHGNVT